MKFQRTIFLHLLPNGIYGTGCGDNDQTKQKVAKLNLFNTKTKLFKVNT